MNRMQLYATLPDISAESAEIMQGKWAQMTIKAAEGLSTTAAINYVAIRPLGGVLSWANYAALISLQVAENSNCSLMIN